MVIYTSALPGCLVRHAVRAHARSAPSHEGQIPRLGSRQRHALRGRREPASGNQGNGSDVAQNIR